MARSAELFFGNFRQCQESFIASNDSLAESAALAASVS
jgi:hypothetical protein